MCLPSSVSFNGSSSIVMPDGVQFWRLVNFLIIAAAKNTPNVVSCTQKSMLPSGGCHTHTVLPHKKKHLDWCCQCWCGGWAEHAVSSWYRAGDLWVLVLSTDTNSRRIVAVQRITMGCALLMIPSDTHTHTHNAPSFPQRDWRGSNVFWN